MEIRKHNEACVVRQVSRDLINVNYIIVFKATREALDVQTEIFSEREQRFVCRLFDQDFIAAMLKGKQIIVTTMSQQHKGVAFPMTLAGFKKVYDSKGLDAKAAQQRQEDLNKALQARAEEARKKLIEQQQKESGGAAPAQ